MARSAVIIGNWKMYKTNQDAASFVRGLIPSIGEAPSLVYLAVPFTDIKLVAELCKETSIVVGAQNMHDVSEGAFTGEIAAKMIKESGARFVILGHSERRRLFGESNEFINRKVKRALQEELTAVLCIGETAQEREQGLTESILAGQLNACLADVKQADADKIFIAYEPVWAIGSSRVATADQAQEAQSFCRKRIEQLFGASASETMRILYGGSVNPDNASSLLEQPDVDGLLVGTASLSSETFSKIVKIQATKHLKLSR